MRTLLMRTQPRITDKTVNCETLMDWDINGKNKTLGGNLKLVYRPSSYDFHSLLVLLATDHTAHAMTQVRVEMLVLASLRFTACSFVHVVRDERGIQRRYRFMINLLYPSFNVLCHNIFSGYFRL